MLVETQNDSLAYLLTNLPSSFAIYFASCSYRHIEASDDSKVFKCKVI